MPEFLKAVSLSSIRNRAGCAFNSDVVIRSSHLLDFFKLFQDAFSEPKNRVAFEIRL